MSFLSGLFGSSKPEAEKEPSASADLFNATTFRSNVNPSPSPSDASASSSSSSSSSIPQSPSTNAAPAPTVSQPAPTALDAFSTSFDAARLHPLAGLSDNLELLQLDEDKLTEIEGAASVLPSRGWTDDLCVGTGTTYLSGLVLGGMWGAKEGLSRPLGNNPSFKLRINSILNGCTRRGSFTGNSLGVLAIFYNLANSSLDSVRGKHDAYNAMGAAALSGAIYKSSAGLRPALVGAGLMTAAAGGWSAFKTMV